MTAVTYRAFLHSASDGTRLAARLWLPDDAGQSPCPRSSNTFPIASATARAARDEPMHGWFAAARLCRHPRRHARLAANPTGMLADEYLPQELEDACEVIAWLAAQPWCNGARRHDGQVLGRLQRAAGRGAAPAGAEGDHHRLLDRRPLRRRHPLHGRRAAQRQSVVGRRSCWPIRRARPIRHWSARAGATQWLERLEHLPFFPALWLAHQRRDAYWRHGSVCEDFSAIAMPGFRRRRLGRCLYQCDSAPARRA